MSSSGARKSHRRNAEKQGRYAETLAALWLSVKGYRILEKRYRTPSGEIDLIAKRSSTLICVEVKRRSTIDLAIRAVTPANRYRIERCAQDFLARHPAFYSFGIRYDIIAIAPWQLRHLKDAWRDH